MVHIKRRYESEVLIRSTVAGSSVIQPKEISAEARLRVQELRNVIHATFVSNVPRIRETNWSYDEYRIIRTDLYEAFQKAKDSIRKIGIDGGQTYNQILFDAKYAHTNYDLLKKVRTALAV